MTENRKIRMVLKSQPTIEGAGVHLKRVFGFSEVPVFDPFLLLDDFHSSTPRHYLQGFPWHPHRGIETITYVLTGDVEHGDSLGNKGVIRSGDVQWMTAGSGIIHQEMPKGDRKGNLWGFQLWANLPAAAKMMANATTGSGSGSCSLSATGAVAPSPLVGEFCRITRKAARKHLRSILIHRKHPCFTRGRSSMACMRPARHSGTSPACW